MKKIIATLLLGGLILGITACGSASKETTEVTNETVQEEVTEVEEKEELIETTPTPTEEPTSEPTEEPKNEFTKDVAEAKVADLFNARNELFKHGRVDTDLNFLVAAETLSGGIKDCGISTADGIDLDNKDDIKTSQIKSASISNFFYDFVNNHCNYYELGNYISNNSSDDIINKYVGEFSDEGTNEIMMYEAPAVIPYLLENLDNLSFGDLISGEECTAKPVSGVEVYYEMPILINGEKCGVTAVFDEAGNLLNLITIEDEGWSEDNYRDSTDEVLALNQ